MATAEDLTVHLAANVDAMVDSIVERYGGALDALGRGADERLIGHLTKWIGQSGWVRDYEHARAEAEAFVAYYHDVIATADALEAATSTETSPTASEHRDPDNRDG